jgi:DNA repair exonuclease SbcCD ATPase subunit
MDNKRVEQPSERERIKKVAVDFFYWWHNQLGNNTEAGFDEYAKTERYKMLDVSITTELDIKDDASLQCASLREENERFKKQYNDLGVKFDKELERWQERDFEQREQIEELKKEVERLKSSLSASERFRASDAGSAISEANSLRGRIGQLQSDNDRLREALKECHYVFVSLSGEAPARISKIIQEALQSNT